MHIGNMLLERQYAETQTKESKYIFRYSLTWSNSFGDRKYLTVFSKP